MKFISEVDFSGPINACSQGAITIRELLDYISSSIGKKVKISLKGVKGPYNNLINCTISTMKATQLGFLFESLDLHLHHFVEGIY
ncbi:hypothetical protein [Bacillus sp. JJ722]|uniref:hypothetical protein n=1 Tax=Bacillus sp. JJ722 TaxID=3122973 RepID=UPI002FFFE4FD